MRTFPLTTPTPSDPHNFHVLLVGGNDGELRAVRQKLKPLGIHIPWHWATVSALHRDLPICDAVVLDTRFCSHSLAHNVVARAKTAQIPLIPNTTWPLTIKNLLKAGIGRAPEDLTMAPAEDKRPHNAPVDLDQLVVEIEEQWRLLDPDLRAKIRHVARAADEHRNEPIPADVRQYLHGFAGNPRAFIATLVLATPKEPLTQTACVKVYKDVIGKRAEPNVVNIMAAKVRDWFGADYGLRRGDAFDLRTLRAPPAPAAPPLPPAPAAPPLPPAPATPMFSTTPTPAEALFQQKLDVGYPAWAAQRQEVSVKTSPTRDLTRARFDKMLHAALDGGETVSVRQDGGAYVLTYEDGTSVTIR